MAAVVAVERLRVVRSAGVLRPELDLVEMELGRLEEALGGVDQVGMECESVELPRAIGKLFDSRELALGELRVARRIGEVVLWTGKVQPERFLRRLELVGREEAFDQTEAARSHFVEGTVGHAHVLNLRGVHATPASRRGV